MVKRLLNQRSQVESAIGHALARAASLSEAVEAIHGVCYQHIQAQVCELWQPAPEAAADGAPRLLRSHLVVAATTDEAEYRRCSPDSYVSGRGLVGRAWETRCAMWLDSMRDEELRDWDCKPAELRSGFAFCINTRDQCVGVLTVFSRLELKPDENFLQMLDSLGETMGEFLRRSEAEAKLERNEQRLRLATEAAGAGVFDYDMANDSLYWDEQIDRIWGFDAGQPRVEAAISAGIHPEDRARTRQVMQRAMEPGGDRHFHQEYRVINRRDDRVFQVTVAGEVFFDADTPVRSLGIVQDVTRHRSLEAALQRSESWFRSLADNIPLLAWMAEPDGSVFWYNRRWYDYTGTDPAKAGDWSSALPKEHRERVLTRYREHIARGELWEDVFPLCNSEGDLLHFLSRAAPVHGDDGQIQHWLGTSTDITRQYEIEDALWEQTERLETSERRYRGLVEALDGVVFENDANTRRFSFVSTRAEQILGYPLSRWMGETHFWRDTIVHPEDRGWTEQEIERCCREEDHCEIIYRALHANGSELWMRNLMRIEHDAAGNPTTCRGVMIDITSHKASEQALRETDRQKDDYLAMLGHELRNPLAAIRGAISLLGQAGDDAGMVQRARDVLERQATHMTVMVDDLLDVSRIARDKLTLQPAVVDLGGIIANVLDDRRGPCRERGIELIYQRSPQPLWVEADRVRIAQVLDNLLGNAVKFTPAGGRIEVSARLSRQEAGESVEVRIRDTGAGIDPEVLPHLFQPFQQGTQDIARSAGGLGLGLALSKGIIELHGGTISGRNLNSGGSEFGFRLQAASRAPTSIARPRPTGDGAGKRLLMVEDHQDAAATMQTLLELHGFEVVAAASGGEALQALRSTTFDAVLCDLGLPDMSGYEVAERARGELGLSDLKMVAVTGYGHKEAVARAREAGFDAHLTKPVDVASMRDILDAQPGH